MSFFERRIDNGIRITGAPKGASGSVLGEIGVIPASFGEQFSGMKKLSGISIVKAQPSDACKKITNNGKSEKHLSQVQHNARVGYQTGIYSI